MRYQAYPGFKTKHWRSLWEANIPDLDSLKHLADTSAFVAIDAEPWGRGGPKSSDVAEVGLALIPPFTTSPTIFKKSEGSPTLASLTDQYHIHRHCIRVAARERRETKREEYSFGQVQFVSAEEVEETLSVAIASFKAQSNANLVLVGFGMGLELKAISTTYTQLTGHFSSWVDLQELVSEVSGTQSPGMRDTLVALGFDTDPLAVRSASCFHNAGNDAVRMAAILLSLIALPSSTRIEITRAPHRKFRTRVANRNIQEKKLWYQTKPKPRELYPFMARVTTTTRGLSMFTVPELFDTFSQYSPTAVGINSGRKYGWVCLPKLQSLICFVQQINGKQAADGYTWSAVMDYDPSVSVAQTAAEFKENRRLEQESQSECKKLERRRRREVEDSEDIEDLTANLGIGEDEENN